MKQVGEKIKFLRIQAKLSQEELAQKLYFSNSTISNWEKGLREVSMENLHNLANFFGVKVTYFLEDSVKPEKANKDSFQQIKYKQIRISTHYFYVLLIAMLINAASIFFPFQSRDIVITLNFLFWIGVTLQAISRYNYLDKQRTKYFLIPLSQNVRFVNDASEKESTYIQALMIRSYSGLLVYTFIYYVSIFGMFHIAMPDPVFTSLMVTYILFTLFVHINGLSRLILTGRPKNRINYNRENIDFGMYRHRAMVTTHYVGMIFFLIFMNAYGYSIFDLNWLIANLLIGFTLVIALHIFLLRVIAYFDKYQLIADSAMGKNQDFLA
jgi:transcriptional regulator with XRE-family HTH domain